MKFQSPEAGGEAADGETKIAMDQYYMDEFDQYAEGKSLNPLVSVHFFQFKGNGGRFYFK